MAVRPFGMRTNVFVVVIVKSAYPPGFFIIAVVINRIALFPAPKPFANFIDNPCHIQPWDKGIVPAAYSICHHLVISRIKARCLYLDPHFAWARLGNRDVA